MQNPASRFGQPGNTCDSNGRVPMRQQNQSLNAPALMAVLLRDDLLHAGVAGGWLGALWLEKILDHVEARP